MSNDEKLGKIQNHVKVCNLRIVAETDAAREAIHH
jgi:hypothetical protein